MRTRFTFAFAVALAAAGPALAEPPKPTLVIRAQPVARLLTEARDVVRQVGGPAQGEQMVKEFDRAIKEALGEQGFEGLDINRPVAAYAAVREKFDATNLVLVVPVTGEKEFLALLDRFKVKTAPVAGKKGLYTVESDALPPFPNGSHLRFADGGWAYLGLNGDEVADPKNLVPPGDLFDNLDQSLVCVRVFPGRFPEKLLKEWLDELDNGAAGIKMFVGRGAPKHVAHMMTTFLTDGPKLVRRYAEAGVKEAAEFAVRLNWDSTTGEGTAEVTLVPKPGTPLAKEIATVPATTNRFAGLVPADAAAGAVIKFPLFAPELRAIIAAALEAGGEELKTGLPEVFRPLAEEITKGLVRTAQKGEADAAIALIGPAKDGKFTLVGGLSFDDPGAVEKALRAVAGKNADVAKVFSFDADKVGDVGIHKITPGKEFPEEFGKVFGDGAVGYLAFAKDAVFVTYGTDALAVMKAALTAKPGPAPALAVTANNKRLHKLMVAAAGEKDAEMFAKFMGLDDKPANVFRVTVEGGEALRVKASLSFRHLPRLGLVGVRAEATFPPPPGR